MGRDPMMATNRGWASSTRRNATNEDAAISRQPSPGLGGSGDVRAQTSSTIASNRAALLGTWR